MFRIPPRKRKYNPVFGKNTWEKIIKACQDNEVPETWVTGSQKVMTINGMDYPIDIIGKDHDDYSDGSGKAPLTFQMHGCWDDVELMNGGDATNRGGWASCYMRTEGLPFILTRMPSELQAAIRAVNKLTSAGNQSSTINTTADKLFLLSEIEVFGGTTNSKNGEGAQYDYYKGSNTKIKNGYGEAADWWTRSPCKSDSKNFCNINSDGDAAITYANWAIGVAFAFCF